MIFYLRTGHGMWTNHDMMTEINGVNEKKRLSYSLSVMTGFRGRRGGGGLTQVLFTVHYRAVDLGTISSSVKNRTRVIPVCGLSPPPLQREPGL